MYDKELTLGFRPMKPSVNQVIKSCCRLWCMNCVKKVKTWRENGYEGAANTSIALLNWWFNQEYLL